MKKLALIVGIFGLALCGLASDAQALSCPAAMPTGTAPRQYTLDPASACVYGDGNIVQDGTGDPKTDPFLSDPDGNGGQNISLITTGGAWNYESTATVAVSGNTAATRMWEITGGDLATKQYLVGIKDGAANPGPEWAVFLVTALKGTWGIASDTSDFINISNLVLYSRDLGPTPTTDPETPVPEPASLLLLGSGLAFGARRVRRRSAASNI
jgi:hypothetical protein